MTSSVPYAGPNLAEPALADPSLMVHAEDRLFAWDGRALRRNKLFYPILVLVLLIHAAALIYFYYRDNKAAMETALLDETPVEVVIEPPPEQPKPPPPPQKKPEPPKPKPEEQIEKPAFSAPRAPNKETVDTKSTDLKTQAPKAPAPPQQGVKAPPQQASKPQDENKDTAKEDAAKPEEDKPDAEALEKAKPKVAPKAAAKPVTKAPLTKKTQDALASLSGESDLPNMTFAKPTPKAPVYGGTEDVRYLAIVQGLIMQKVKTLPRLDHYQDGGEVAVYFHLDDSGRVISMEILKKSGMPGIDAMAMDAVRQASPFPPPPRGVPHGLVWGTSVDGQLPMRAMR